VIDLAVLLDLSKITAILLMGLVIFLSIGLSILIYRMTEKKSDWKGVKYLSHLVRPFPLKPLTPVNSNEMTEKQVKTHLNKQLALRLTIIYLLIAFFFIANIIGEINHIICQISWIEILIPSELTWTGVLIETPFKSSWYGYVYASSPFYLPYGEFTYDSWSMFFFGSAISENSEQLFFTLSSITIILTFVIGGLFLLMLTVQSIRKSFLASLFFFNAGMFCSVKGIFGCFSRAWSLEFGSAYIQYGIITVTANQLQGITTSVLITLFPIILLLFVVFVFIGKKLWQVHYPHHEISHYWFTIYVIASYWLNFFFLFI
jgi:hypothetical protein